jgi:hypothetical protein
VSDSNDKSLVQLNIIKEYFEMYPDIEIHTKDVVDWVASTYLNRTGKIFRDPDRGIRSLYQKGFLQKIAKGVYKYDLKYTQNKKQEDFTSVQKRRF